MAAKIEVWLDDDRRFVRQRIDGDMTAEDFQHLEDEMQRLVPQVLDPENVMILFDATRAAKGTSQARRAMVRSLGRTALRRLAVVNPSAIGRVMVRFMLTVSGVKKVRIFDDEKAAIDWLMS
jgi:hypothetical protein